MYKFEPTTPKAVEEREVTISFTRLTISALITYFKIYIYILHGNGGKRADVSPDSLKPQYTIFFFRSWFFRYPTTLYLGDDDDDLGDECLGYW